MSESGDVSALTVRVSELEDKLEKERLAVQPILDFWNASKLLGRLLVILGGMAVGAITIWKIVGDWVAAHIK